MPDGTGVSIANDECVMMSPEMHDTFSVPYMNMLSEEFGALRCIHAATGRTSSPVSTSANLRGLEFARAKHRTKECCSTMAERSFLHVGSAAQDVHSTA